MATVNMHAVSKFYDDRPILKDINLQVEKGEFVAIVGQSGSGKSTLLRMVAGLDTVSSGSILINNQCVNTMPAASRDTAMVFQHYALYPHMSAYDNMAYGLKLRGIKKAEIDERVHAVADMLQLGEYLDRKPAQLSGGQCQRVAMGRAIIRKPAVCLFDEPLSHLDAKLRTEMRHEIKKLHQQLKMTCLYVTHDQTEAMTLADRVVVLNKGLVEQIGTPRELYESPATVFVASFIGLYPMNFLPSTFNGLKKIDAFDKSMVAIRPEHISLTTQAGPDLIPVFIEFVDDMGSDKLIQVRTESDDIPLTIRVQGDTPIHEGSMLAKLDWSKAHLFSQQTGQRLGDSHEAN